MNNPELAIGYACGYYYTAMNIHHVAIIKLYLHMWTQLLKANMFATGQLPWDAIQYAKGASYGMYQAINHYNNRSIS